MLASREGMGLVKDAQRLTERMRDGVITAPAPTGGVQGGAQAVQFQNKFDAKDSYDDEMNTKMQLMDQDGMTPFGQVYYDDKVGRWLERKAAAAETANFDSYFNLNFNKNDLASRQWAQEVNPKFYADREREMNERAEIVLKLKKIQLRGPQNKEDLQMLYLIESGRVKLPEDWDVIGPGYHDTSKSAFKGIRKANQKNFRAGLIRMPLFLTEKQRQTRATNNGVYGAWGDANGGVDSFATGEAYGGGVRNKQNHPLSSDPEGRNGRTLGFNFQKFLQKGQ
jgi:hypothetical protein